MTIPVSHYCEKARWAMTRAGIAFREEGHLPVFNRFAGLRFGVWNSAPWLRWDEGLLRDSSDILRWVEDRAPEGRKLFPQDEKVRGEIAQWCQLFDDELGPTTRRLAYSWVLPNKAVAMRISSENVPALEVLMMRLGFVLVRAGMKRGLKIDSKHLTLARETVDRIFERVGLRLKAGRKYLCGEAFSVADLTFAALAAPVVLPSGHGGPLPAFDELPKHAQAEVERLRATVAGQFALRLYETERSHASP